MPYRRYANDDRPGQSRFGQWNKPQPSDTFEYRFLAKIDFNGFVPTQRVEETGEIKLQ